MKHRLVFDPPRRYQGTTEESVAIPVRSPDAGLVGEITVEVVKGDVVVTVARIDEANFGPVSTVVV